LLPESILSAFDNPLILLSPDALSQIHAGFAAYGAQGTAAFNMLLQAVKTGLAQSIHNVFMLSLVVILFGLLAVFLLKEIPLRERKKQEL
jgi:putative exporter of polyketide antibiotics